MLIHRVHLRNFRGFADLIVMPHTHVVLMGEPGAGRSDLVEGLRRVMSVDSTRLPLTEPTDFYGGDLTSRAEVEITIGGLEPDQEQLFMDRLEVWNSDSRELVPELDELDRLEDERLKWVVR